MLPGKRDSSKFVHGHAGSFPSLSGIWEIMATQIHVLAANVIHQGERSVSPINQANYTLSDLVSDCLTEMVR